MVDAIKQDGEVGVSYMKSWEWEEMIRRQGISKGETVKLISQVKKKIEKGIHAEDIANILEEDIQLITKIHDSIRTYPDWDNEKIYDHLTQSETTNYPQIP